MSDKSRVLTTRFGSDRQNAVGTIVLIVSAAHATLAILGFAAINTWAGPPHAARHVIKPPAAPKLSHPPRVPPRPGQMPGPSFGPGRVLPSLLGGQGPTKIHYSLLIQRMPNNRTLGLTAVNKLHPKLIQHLRWRRRQGDWFPWSWGYWSLGNYGLAGNVTSVLTGDTLMVTNGAGSAQTFRLFGVKAPADGVHAAKSQRRLAMQLLNQFVHVHRMGIDADGVPVAKIIHGGSYVNEDQIRAGMAWYFIDDGLDRQLARAEADAQNAGQGLWSDPYPKAPWLVGAAGRPMTSLLFAQCSLDATARQLDLGGVWRKTDELRFSRSVFAPDGFKVAGLQNGESSRFAALHCNGRPSL